MGGWVKLYRKALDNPIVCKDAEHLAIWIYLLLSATHTPIERVFNGEKIILQPGQLIRCTATISSKLRVSNSKVNRVLKCFESDKQIERLTKRHGTLFTLLNWSDYQANEKPNEEQMEDQWKTNERPVETNKKLRSKEVKEINNKDSTFQNIINEYTTNEQLIDALNAFVSMRKDIKKPLTERAINMLLTKLTKLSKDDDCLKIKLLDQSVFHNWQDIFPLKEDGIKAEQIDRPLSMQEIQKAALQMARQKEGRR